jgi:prolyl 4-hydroxylase
MQIKRQRSLSKNRQGLLVVVVVVVIVSVLLLLSLGTVLSSSSSSNSGNYRDGDEGVVCDSSSSTSSSNAAEQCVLLNSEDSSSFNSSGPTAVAVCADAVSENCTERSRNDGCIKDFGNMQQDCPATCLLCTTNSSVNATTTPSSSKNTNTMQQQVQNIYSDQPQWIVVASNSGHDAKAAMQDFVHRVDDYMYHQVYADAAVDGFSMTDRLACKNRHEQCTYWAHGGECQVNPEYMKLSCAPACFSCHELEFQRRCRNPQQQVDAQATAAWTSPFGGDLNRMFERIVSDAQYQSKVNILSRPRVNETTTTTEIIPDGPWVIVLDDFLTTEECETMIQLGHNCSDDNGLGFQRSVDQSPDLQLAGNLQSVVTQHRTSSTAWCTNDACANHIVTQRIVQKMEHLTNISHQNYEYLQLLQYTVGQSYGYHHDYTTDHLLRPQGPRILTVFCYLNNVEAGGGTRFSLLNLVCWSNAFFAMLYLDQEIHDYYFSSLHISLSLFLQRRSHPNKAES